MEIVYYEDVELHQSSIVGEYYVDKEEMLEFAKKWDRQPFHIDEELAQSYPFGGLIASSSYTMAIVSRVASIAERPRMAILAGLEYERVQIPNPVRPDDQLVVTAEHIDKRESKTKPDRGIVRTLVEVKNKNDELVFSAVGVSLVAKRPI